MVKRHALCGSVFEINTTRRWWKEMSPSMHWHPFPTKKTEHYGSFIRCEHGTKMNFEKMTNFAIPLVILTWHWMIQEYFWKHENKTFFHYGNYMERKQRFPKNVPDLYMMDSIETKVHITSFDMICPNSDADISKEACL